MTPVAHSAANSSSTIDPDDVAYLRKFSQAVIKQRIPLDGSLELTHRCNLRVCALLPR